MTFRGDRKGCDTWAAKNTVSFYEQNYDKPLFLNGQEPVGCPAHRLTSLE